jgi:hypothetical protein
MDSAAVARGDHTTRGAAGLQLVGLHGHHQPLPIVNLHPDDVDTRNIEHHIGSGAPARAKATHRVRHRRVLRKSAHLCQAAAGKEESWSLVRRR